MTRDNGQNSQDYRADHTDRFKKMENGKFGGYKRGVPNGPEARRAPRNRK